MDDEIWKDIKGYEGYYQVSQYGRVKSLPRWKRKREWVLKPYTNGRGYLQVGLRKDGKVKMHLVHRLVMMHFEPIDSHENYEVNHKNFNTTDNTIDNLEWCTKRENYDHYWDAINNGEYRAEGSTGTEHHLSVLNVESVTRIRELYDNGEVTNKSELGRMFNVGEATIRQVVTRTTWKDIE